MSDRFEQLLKDDREDFEFWFQKGVQRGWISQPFCIEDDAPKLTDIEQRLLWLHGKRPCVIAVRVWPMATWALPTEGDGEDYGDVGVQR